MQTQTTKLIIHTGAAPVAAPGAPRRAGQKRARASRVQAGEVIVWGVGGADAERPGGDIQTKVSNKKARRGVSERLWRGRRARMAGDGGEGSMHGGCGERVPRVLFGQGGEGDRRSGICRLWSLCVHRFCAERRAARACGRGRGADFGAPARGGVRARRRGGAQGAAGRDAGDQKQTTVCKGAADLRRTPAAQQRHRLRAAAHAAGGAQHRHAVGRARPWRAWSGR